MKCPFCNIEMIEADEFCWHVGEPIKLGTGELYSKKHTCPKCRHWERSDFYFSEPKKDVDEGD